LLLRVLELVPLVVKVREVDVRFDPAFLVDREFSIRFQESLGTLGRRRRTSCSQKSVVAGANGFLKTNTVVVIIFKILA
jgi:hypothetical protein